MKITIRNRFDTKELPILYALERECFEGEFRWAEFIFNKELLAALPKNNIWIAETSGKIAGFLLAGKERGKAHIETVNIAKKYRRRGIATMLIKACETEFKQRGLSEIKLEVHVDNPAQILYFQLGYRVTQFRRHYYASNSHGLHMTKYLLA